MSNKPHNTKSPKSNIEYVDENEIRDDAVIGTAIKWSLLALLIIVGSIGLTAYILTRPEVLPEAQIVDVQAPQAIQQRSTPPAVTFTDITQQAGITFRHFNGATGEKLLPETMGGGVAFFDYDNDDDQDLLLINATSWPHDLAKTNGESPQPTMALYANNGSGSFTDVTAQAGLNIPLFGRASPSATTTPTASPTSSSPQSAATTSSRTTTAPSPMSPPQQQ